MGFLGAVFDLDGTLLDTLADIANAMNRVLEQAGLPVHPLENYRYFVGEGATVLASKVLPSHLNNEEMINNIRDRFIEEYSGSWRKETRPYPGVLEMLNQLREMGIKMAVLSNKPHDFTRLCVETFLDHSLFAVVWGERPGVPRKPDPAAAIEIAELFGLKVEQMVYVGDTAIDMATAKGAGMFAVGVLWGFRDEGELRESGADIVISHPSQLLELFRGENR